MARDASCRPDQITAGFQELSARSVLQERDARAHPLRASGMRPPSVIGSKRASVGRISQEWVRWMMLGTSLKALVECSRSMTSTDFRSELRKIQVPTLVIHGDKDVSAAIDLTGGPTARMIPGAELKVVVADRVNAPRRCR